MAKTPQFEIPSQMRELAERSVEQARSAYNQYMDAFLNAQGMWLSAMSGGRMPPGFKEIQDKAIGYAKQNGEACFAMASELAACKDVTEMIAIQTRFAQSQLQTYASQGQEMGKLLTQAAQKAGRG